jgi:uncharacterized protein
MPRIPYVDYLVLDPDPHLVGNRCASCGALFLDRRNACASCGMREFEPTALARAGTIRAFTIVHRATPDVPVPYVSVIVDLDGGGTVKGNLVDVGHDPVHIPMGGRVQLTTQVAGQDRDGTRAVSFAFRLDANGDHSGTSEE